MPRSLWVIRIFFLALCVLTGYAVSQVQPDLIENGTRGLIIGFGFGGLLIAIDEMLKGFSLRAFSAATFGLLFGTLIAFLIQRSGLFEFVDERTLYIIRLCLFVGFGYIGMVLAMRSNKEDVSLIIPYVRFVAQNKPNEVLLLDTSAIIDGRISDLLESGFLNGVVVVPQFVLRELQLVADSGDPTRKQRGRRGLEILGRLRSNRRIGVRIHEGEVEVVKEVDSKLVYLAKALDARLVTIDNNLARIAALQGVDCLDINELSRSLRPVIMPDDELECVIVREGRDRGQGVGFLTDGTMVVVNEASRHINQRVRAKVLNVITTGGGPLVFAKLLNVRIESPNEANILPA